eukprot:g3527.t1
MLSLLLDHPIYGANFTNLVFNPKGISTSLIDEKSVGLDGDWRLAIVPIDSEQGESIIPQIGTNVKAVRNDPCGFYLEGMRGTVDTCLSTGGPGGYRVSVIWEWYPCNNWYHVLQNVESESNEKWGGTIPKIGDIVVAVADSKQKFFECRPHGVSCNLGDTGIVMHVSSPEEVKNVSDVTAWIKWNCRKKVGRPTGVPEKYVGPDESPIKRRGVTMLMLAAAYDRVDVINLLMSKNKFDQNNNVTKGDDDDGGTDAHIKKRQSLLLATDERSWNALMYSQRNCQRGAEDVLKQYSQQFGISTSDGVSPFMIAAGGMSPFMVAAFFGNLKKIQSMLNEGIGNLQQVSVEGKTPLHYAAEGCHPKVVQFLLKNLKSSDLERIFYQFGNTPLMLTTKACCHTRDQTSKQNWTCKDERLRNRYLVCMEELLNGIEGKESSSLVDPAIQYVQSCIKRHERSDSIGRHKAGDIIKDGTLKGDCLELLEQCKNSGKT